MAIALLPLKASHFDVYKLSFLFLTLFLTYRKMSLYPTLEDMEVTSMAKQQAAAEQQLTQQAITAASSGGSVG